MHLLRIPRTKRGVTAYIFAVAMLTFSIFTTANTSPLKVAKAPTNSTAVENADNTTEVLGANDEIHIVTKVIDGDTFQIDSGEKVRMIGIDTPETVDPRRAVGCYGKEASNHTKELLLNKTVTLVKDVSNTDSFGRLLRYVYVDNVFVNKELVRDGYATAKTFPPDVKFQEELKTAEREAFSEEIGLWGKACVSTVK